MTPAQKRTTVAALALSATAFVGLMVDENYVGTAMIPTRNDRPTVGFGSTFNENGTPVKLGDRTTPVRALIKAQAHISKAEGAMKACITAPVSQNEYDTYLQLSYNIGSVAFCRSTLVKKLNALDYTGACEQILVWDKFKGKPLRGLTLRREREYQQCLGHALPDDLAQRGK